jgi:asparagine synthase (glutamine-hydrolysing)
VLIRENVRLTANARLDGREELIEKLQRNLTLKQSPNDEELILYAYEAWGEDCIKHLIGDFAFAIWDSRLQRIFCARDQFGVKPFFFTHIANEFNFSSTLNELRQDPRVSDTLNEVAIGDYLLFGVNQDLSTTTFKDIQRLPPAHSLTVSEGSLTMRRYWTPDTSSEVRFRDRNSYVERFSELLSRAVEDRLGTNRVSVSMSGGLDSTAIAAIACDRLGTASSLQACTVVYDLLIPDEERHYAQAAAEHLGIPISYVIADRYSLFDEQVPGDMDQPEPFLLSAFTAQFHNLLRLCAAHGPVALTGFDGDAFMNEPFSSYFTSSAKNLKLKSLATGMGWYVCTQRALPPIGFRTRIKQIFREQQSDSFFPEWINESFGKRNNLRERCYDVCFPQRRNGTKDESRPAALQALNSKIWAPLFEGYDRAATKLDLDVRHPLTDLRLVEYLLAIPAVPWCVNKHILRLAMKDRLPATVVNRPKTPLAGNPALQLARHASVRWLDSFEVNPQLRDFVNLDLRRSIADEQTPDGLWASLRVFALNYWLTNSQPIARRATDNQVNKIAAASR